MEDKPDFDKLRAERDAEIAKIVKEVARKLWGDDAAESVAFHVNFGGGSTECYCACASGGPCEHEFSGWRDFDDGLGGETFCQKCGIGAIQHSVATEWGAW